MFVTLDGQRLFFDVVGAGLAPDAGRMREKPTLLVLHGGPGFDHSGLRSFFDRFADVAQVIYLDHRGNGRSMPSDKATWTLATWGDDIVRFCAALGIERPVVLGQSFGGMVAQSYAIRHPGHARGLILSSTAARMDFDASMKLFLSKGGPEALALAEKFWSVGDDEMFEAYTRVCMPLYNTTVPTDGADSRARAITRPEVFRHFSLPGGEIRSMDFRGALSRVTCPVLVLCGDSDPITPAHLSEEILASLQPSIGKLVRFEGCGHGPFRDDPDRVHGVIRGFLESL
jgi:proline-specific peptidase